MSNIVTVDKLFTYPLDSSRSRLTSFQAFQAFQGLEKRSQYLLETIFLDDPRITKGKNHISNLTGNIPISTAEFCIIKRELEGHLGQGYISNLSKWAFKGFKLRNKFLGDRKILREKMGDDYTLKHEAVLFSMLKKSDYFNFQQYIIQQRNELSIPTFHNSTGYIKKTDKIKIHREGKDFKKRFPDREETFVRLNHFFTADLKNNNFTDNEIEKIQSAFSLAQHAHFYKNRDKGELYLFHPVRACLNAVRNGEKDVDLLILILLHDTIEDNPKEVIEFYNKDFNSKGISKKLLQQEALKEIKIHFGSQTAEELKILTKEGINKAQVKAEMPGASKNEIEDRVSQLKKEQDLYYYENILGKTEYIRCIKAKIYDRMDNLDTLDGMELAKHIVQLIETSAKILPLADRVVRGDLKDQSTPEECNNLESLREALTNKMFFVSYKLSYYIEIANKFQFNTFLRGLIPPNERDFIDNDGAIASITATYIRTTLSPLVELLAEQNIYTAAVLENMYTEVINEIKNRLDPADD